MTASTQDRWAKTGAAGGGGGADASAATGKGEKEKKPKKSLLKSKKFLIAMVVLLGGGGAAYEVLAPPAKAAPPAPGDVVVMDPTTLNLTDGHYLKIAVSIELVKGKASLTSFTTGHAAELVIDEFSNRSVASLSSYQARTQRTDALQKAIEKAYPGEVFDIFVTQFVMQ